MTSPRPWLLVLDANEPWHAIQCEGLDVAQHGSRWVAFHGTLYDAGAIATDFDAPPASPGSAALILAGIDRWGFDRALSRLRGVFVVASGDEDRREAFVARDPLGSHPLFYSETGDRHVFAESARALRSLPGVSSKLSRVVLADHLCHRWPEATETFFEGIRRVPPGCLVRLSSHSRQFGRHFDPAPPGRPIAWAADDVVSQFPAIFNRAIDRCLDRGPAAVFLSGGLDSISVAAGAADRARERRDAMPWALSLAMPDPECDERETQAQIATALGMPLRLVEFDDAVGSRGVVAAATDVGRTLSSPLLNFWAPAYLSLAEAASQDGVRTVLSGSGGDEWLSVSPYLAADLLARGDLRGWWQFFLAFRRSYQHSWWKHAKLCTWTFGARPLASRSLARAFPGPWRRRRERGLTSRDPQWIAPDASLRRLQRDRAAKVLDDPDPAQGFYVREMRSGLDHPLTSWELEEQYEFGKASGQAFLHPYWDADLVDILYRTPPALLSGGGRAKGLVRGTLARRFPMLGLDRQRKVSGTSFYRTLVNSQLPKAAQDVGECRALADLGVITTEAAREYGSPDFGTPVNRWDVINLETWVRANG